MRATINLGEINLSVSNCNLSEKQNQRRAHPGSVGYQSVVPRSDHLSFHVSFQKFVSCFSCATIELRVC